MLQKEKGASRDETPAADGGGVGGGYSILLPGIYFLLSRVLQLVPFCSSFSSSSILHTGNVYLVFVVIIVALKFSDLSSDAGNCHTYSTHLARTQEEED